MTNTVRNLVDDSLAYIGEVAGAGVQQYSEDRVREGVIRGFDMLFKRRRWENYRKWFRLQLDGTTGKFTTDDLENIRDFEDFIGIYRDAEATPLAIMPTNLNPYTMTGSSTRPLFWTSLYVADADYLTKRLQFYPVTATGFINVFAMVYPLDPIEETWDWEDIMYLDNQLLVYAASIEVMASDDMNANAVTVAQSKMEARFKDVIGTRGDFPIPIRSNVAIPNQWTISP